MAVVLISNLAPIGSPEAAFFADFIGGFEEYGHQVVFWSTVGHPRLDRILLPSDWRLKEWSKLYPVDQLAELRPGQIDIEKWRARVDVLTKQDVDDDQRPALLDTLFRVSQHVIDTVKPDLFIAWNTFCPHTGVATDLCRAAGIPVEMLERGPLPDTWMSDHGLLGHSRLAGQASTPACHPLDSLRGRAVLADLDVASFNRYAQKADTATLSTLNGQPRIVVLPPDDSTVGFFPADGPDRSPTLPGFQNSFDVATAIASARPDACVIFKPHPSFGRLSFDTTGYSNLHVEDIDFRALIDWSDVVVSTGTGLSIIAWAMNRPVVLAARDMFAGKGVAYEALDAESLPAAIDQAVARADKKRRQASLYRLLGWLKRCYLLHPEMAPAWTRSARSEVATLHDRHLGGRPTWASARALIQATRENRVVPVPQEDDCETDFATFPAALLQPGTSRALVDFDHTLIDGNSTELYLSSIRPRWAAALVHALLWRLAPWLRMGDTPTEIRTREVFRVGLLTALFPWSPLLWRWQARRLARQRVVRPLLDALHHPDAPPIDIVSIGFRFIITPMVRALDLPDARIIAEDLWKGPRIRLAGKDVTLRALIPDDDLANAVAITDSRDDAPIFPLVRRAWLVRWPGPRKILATTDTYLPFRYTAEGKYPGKSILRHQHFGEDLVVTLLAFGLTPGASWTIWLVLPLLFVSFFAVYEIGYHENDFLAARREQKPTLSGQHGKFARTPVERQGWLWGACGGALATMIAGWPDLTTMATGFAVWMAVLASARLLFGLFNRLPEGQRPFVFPFLQVAKTLGPASLLSLSPAGLILALSQVFRQATNYVVYRSGGDVRTFKRQTYRLIVAGVLLLAVTLATPGAIAWSEPQIWLILGWIGHRVLRERFGFPLKAQARGLWRMITNAPRRLRDIVRGKVKAAEPPKQPLKPQPQPSPQPSSAVLDDLQAALTEAGKEISHLKSQVSLHKAERDLAEQQAATERAARLAALTSSDMD